MIMKNAVQKAEKIRVPGRFSISCDQLAELSQHYEGRFTYGCMAFRLKYMQGMKAAKAEQKRKEAAACKE